MEGLGRVGIVGEREGGGMGGKRAARDGGRSMYDGLLVSFFILISDEASWSLLLS